MTPPLLPRFLEAILEKKEKNGIVNLFRHCPLEPKHSLTPFRKAIETSHIGLSAQAS